MPVQSEIIRCPAGQWTSIAQAMPRRRALIVQCPQVPQVLSIQRVNVVDDGTSQVIATSSVWRTSLQIQCLTFPVGASSGTVFPNPPSAGPGGIYVVGATRIEVTKSSWGEMTGSQWSAVIYGDGLGVVEFDSLQASDGCRAIILGVNKGVPTNQGPNGVDPFGIWHSNDLAAGGSQFRLSVADDADLTVQEWYAFPTGVSLVSVQVFQSFDDPPFAARDDYATFDVGLPQLSSIGKFHLDSLRRKISGAPMPAKNPDEEYP